MIIKKYYGESETEAVLLAKEDLGKDAIVTNIKKNYPKGIFKYFRKPTVEITAAIDNTSSYNQKDIPYNMTIEEKIKHIQSILESQTEERTKEKISERFIDGKISERFIDGKNSERNIDDRTSENIFGNNKYAETIFEQLLKNGLEEKYINQIFREVQIKEDLSLDQTLSLIYQRLVLKLGQTKNIEIEKDKCKFIFFIGPTGVGKTTTIAKIASSLSIYKDAKVALLTLDTYRIAAVEQLKTYASILDLPIEVIYSIEEFNNIKDDFSAYDIVLVDTAGMSYKNKEKQQEIEKYVNIIDEDSKEIYVTLSLTTKYEDLINIVKHYSSLADYSLLFTKLDETSNIGCILNLKMVTGADLSYVTIGQNVPDDILIIDTQSIAKQLLGGVK